MNAAFSSPFYGRVRAPLLVCRIVKSMVGDSWPHADFTIRRSSTSFGAARRFLHARGGVRRARVDCALSNTSPGARRGWALTHRPSREESWFYYTTGVLTLSLTRNPVTLFVPSLFCRPSVVCARYIATHFPREFWRAERFFSSTEQFMPRYRKSAVHGMRCE